MVSYGYFLAFNYVVFSQKCPPKTKSKIWFFFFNILKSKQVEYVSALCNLTNLKFEKFAIWKICNLKNDYKKRLQPCEKKISIDWQRRQSVVVMGVLPPGDVALYYYWWFWQLFHGCFHFRFHRKRKKDSHRQ